MDFLRRLADASPLPAGGAAVAYTLGLALGLLNKLILLEIHRRADQPEVEKNLLIAKKELESLLRDAERLVQQDAETFERFFHYRKSGDRRKIETEFNNLIEVSLRVLQHSDSAFLWVRRLAPMVPKWMQSHLLVASELMMGSVNGSAHLIRANLRALNAATDQKTYLDRLSDLQTTCREKYRAILQDLPAERS